VDVMKALAEVEKFNPNMVLRSSNDENHVKISVTNVKNLIDKENVLEELLFRENSFEITRLDSMALLYEFMFAMSAYEFNASSEHQNRSKLFVSSLNALLVCVYLQLYPNYKIGILPKNQLVKSGKGASKATEERLNLRLSHIHGHTRNIYNMLPEMLGLLATQH